MVLLRSISVPPFQNKFSTSLLTLLSHGCNELTYRLELQQIYFRMKCL